MSLTDDRGLHWRGVRWNEWQFGTAIAFDPTSDFGVLIGNNGMLAVTEDRGESWTIRRDNVGQMLTSVAVVGRTVAFGDDGGGVWVSFDGGISVRTLAEGGNGRAATITVERGAIWILVGGSFGAPEWWRADASGNLERVSQ